MGAKFWVFLPRAVGLCVLYWWDRAHLSYCHDQQNDNWFTTTKAIFVACLMRHRVRDCRWIVFLFPFLMLFWCLERLNGARISGAVYGRCERCGWVRDSRRIRGRCAGRCSSEFAFYEPKAI
ncbi:hypothetical protein B0O99DRAFT_145326 [Bisporella sp. PMI_857]|nr:hypothetical protein B0O99DRAFT_145326 [Bisporella sp. PMI_857]